MNSIVSMDCILLCEAVAINLVSVITVTLCNWECKHGYSIAADMHHRSRSVHRLIKGLLRPDVVQNFAVGLVKGPV